MKILLKKILNFTGYKITRVTQHISSDIAFLHIGKNSGTQIMFIAHQLKEHGVNIKKYKHFVKLSDLPMNTKYFFSIRNPATRFVSGFYSRKKRENHTPHEKIAFENFEHSNDIAENLFADGEKGNSARNAIKSIGHTSFQQIDWFQSTLNFKFQPPITIIRQEHFEQDMQRFLDLLNVKIKISNFITEDKIIAHKNNYNEVPPLSEKAIANLERWYVQDYMFYEMCVTWLKENNHID